MEGGSADRNSDAPPDMFLIHISEAMDANMGSFIGEAFKARDRISTFSRMTISCSSFLHQIMASDRAHRQVVKGVS